MVFIYDHVQSPDYSALPVFTLAKLGSVHQLHVQKKQSPGHIFLKSV